MSRRAQQCIHENSVKALSDEHNDHDGVEPRRQRLPHQGECDRRTWRFGLPRDLAPATTAISGGSQRQGIRTWHFLRRFECGASWTAVALYLPPKADFFFWASRAGRSPAWAPRSGAGGRAGGGTPPPQRFLRSYWVGEGLWACQKGQIGQKLVRFGQLGAARSLQDELIERRPENRGPMTHIKSK
jgi:hypothetical protein